MPTAHGKADLTLYRSEGRRVLDVLARLARTERASIDECYLDLTEEAQRRLEDCGGVAPLPCNAGASICRGRGVERGERVRRAELMICQNEVGLCASSPKMLAATSLSARALPILPPRAEQVHVMAEAGFVGATDWWQRPQHEWRPGERLLACAAAAVADLREAVRQELGYTCSAGIAHTKLMAKLCSGYVERLGHSPCKKFALVEAVWVPHEEAICCTPFSLSSPTWLDAAPCQAGCTSLHSRLCSRQTLCLSCWARCPSPS